MEATKRVVSEEVLQEEEEQEAREKLKSKLEFSDRIQGRGHCRRHKADVGKVMLV